MIAEGGGDFADTNGMGTGGGLTNDNINGGAPQWRGQGFDGRNHPLTDETLLKSEREAAAGEIR